MDIDFGCLVEAYEMSFYLLDRKQIYQKNLEIYCSIRKEDCLDYQLFHPLILPSRSSGIF